MDSATRNRPGSGPPRSINEWLVNRLARFLLAAGTAAVLSSCEKSGSNPQSAGKSDPSASTRANAGSPLEVVTKSGVEMVYLPGGEFQMGSASGGADEAPTHKVQVSAFLIDKF